MKVTYKNLYSLVDKSISKKVKYNNSNTYDSQLSRDSVSPMIGSSLGDTEIASLISGIQDLMSAIVPSHLVSGLTVEATDPISSSVIIKKGTGVADGTLYELEDDVTIEIPLETGLSVYYLNLYKDHICIDSGENSKKLTIAKIVVPEPGTTIYIQDTQDDSLNAYIQNYTEYKLYGDIYGVFEEDTVELLRNNIGNILADNLIGNIRLNEDLKIINTAGTLELNSNSLIFNDFDGNVLAKFNTSGIHFYNAVGTELARFTTDDAFIGNILITKNTLESKNFLTGVRGFQLKDDGNVEFNNLNIRGTIYATYGEIGGWSISENSIYGTTTGSIKTSANAGAGYNGVILDIDGLRVYDEVLGCVVNLPSDGSAPTFSSGVINSVVWEIDTESIIRTSETVGDGSSSSAGILINNTGLYGVGANQTLNEANLKALIDGTIYISGEINCNQGNIGGVTISDDGIYGGIIQGSTIRSPIIETSDALPKIRIDSNGIYYQLNSNIGMYGAAGSGLTGFLYGDGTVYGSGVYAYLFNENYPAMAILSETEKADIRLYNRSADPVSGSHEIGDLIVVNGKLKICSVAGTPGSFIVVGAQTA